MDLEKVYYISGNHLSRYVSIYCTVKKASLTFFFRIRDIEILSRRE